jgi:lipid II:glycine glycyltransferase (peptidoglycan interpeptide bridge formation enzyme)
MSIYMFDLTKSKEELFAAMDHDRRSNVRKAQKLGVLVELANDMQFVDEYYEQTEEVFAKQSLETPYSLQRVKQLVEQFIQSQSIGLVRARNSEGVSIATEIDLAFNKVVVGWGAASKREYQILRPNEACYWYCINYWKDKGFEKYRIGGGWSQYKKSYGCDKVPQIRLMLGKDPFLDKLTELMFSLHSPKLRNWTIKHLKG